MERPLILHPRGRSPARNSFVTSSTLHHGGRLTPSTLHYPTRLVSPLIYPICLALEYLALGCRLCFLLKPILHPRGRSLDRNSFVTSSTLHRGGRLTPSTLHYPTRLFSPLIYPIYLALEYLALGCRLCFLFKRSLQLPTSSLPATKFFTLMVRRT